MANGKWEVIQVTSDTWNEIFKAAFECTKESFGMLVFPHYIDHLSEFHASARADTAVFTVRTDDYVYSTDSFFVGSPALMVIKDTFSRSRLHVSRRQPEPAAPRNAALDNPTPPGITREEVERRKTEQRDTHILTMFLEYHVSEANKLTKQLLELQGDHNNGD